MIAGLSPTSFEQPTSNIKIRLSFWYWSPRFDRFLLVFHTDRPNKDQHYAVETWRSITKWPPWHKRWSKPFIDKLRWIYFFKLLSSFFCLYNRSTWQRVNAVRLFIEHTYPGSSACHRADVGNAFKLWKVRINLVLKILSCSSPGDEWENSLGTRLGENRRSRCILVCPKCKYASHFNQSLETSRSVPLSCKHWGFRSDSCH